MIHRVNKNVAMRNKMKLSHFSWDKNQKPFHPADRNQKHSPLRILLNVIQATWPPSGKASESRHGRISVFSHKICSTYVCIHASIYKFTGLCVGARACPCTHM